MRRQTAVHTRKRETRKDRRTIGTRLPLLVSALARVARVDGHVCPTSRFSDIERHNKTHNVLRWILHVESTVVPSDTNRFEAFTLSADHFYVRYAIPSRRKCDLQLVVSSDFVRVCTFLSPVSKSRCRKLP